MTKGAIGLSLRWGDDNFDYYGDGCVRGEKSSPPL
jgi:hypothetical protein